MPSKPAKSPAKSASKTGGAKAASTKKAAASKPAKAPAKKAAKKAFSKAPEKKPAAKIGVPKAVAAKAAAPKVGKAKTTGASPKAMLKPVPGKGKSEAKKPEPKKPEPKKVEAKKVEAKAGGDAPEAGKRNTSVVNPKMVKKKPAIVPVMPVGLGRLLDPKNPVRRPLIPSGPKATNQRPLGQHGGYEPDVAPLVAHKTNMGKKELEHFRTLLLRKRAEVLADVSNMESEALNSGSGSLSNMPTHLAEAGTEAFDQALSLDLAAAERKLIREIDEAVKRIDAGTFGMCELTGKPIGAARLEEIPWARHSIEAAIEVERQAMRRH